MLWGGLGPIMKFSDTWATPHQHGDQHRHVPGRISDSVRAELGDTRAIRLKLDELLRATEGARPALIDLNRFSDEQIERLEQELHEWRQQTPRRRDVE